MKTYLGLYVKFPVLLSDCSKIWSFSTDFRGRSQFQISRKSVQWEPRCYMRTDGHM